MSVKHLEYLRISNSKILLVEVRPVKCLLDTSMGPALTDKWLEYSHWKEIYHLLEDIAEEYEEQKITQGIKYNQPKCKIGATIQMGYMFRSLPSCWCSLYFLTPRNPPIWEKNVNAELQDKGGRFENFGLCGEMLVVSAILRDSLPSSTTEVASTLSSSGTYQQECLNHKLIKALDCRATYTTSISNYFKASTSSADDISAKCVSSSSRERQRSPPLRVKTNTRFNEEHEGNRDECNESMMGDISDCDSSFKPSRSNYLEEVNSETEEKEMDLPCGISVHDIFNGTKSFHNSLEYTKGNFTSIPYNNENLENSTEREVEPAYQCSDITSDGTYNTSVSSLNESNEMLPDSEIHMYQYDTVNGSNVSCSVSTNTCNSLMSNSELENVHFEPRSDRSTARDTAHEVDRNSKFHITEDNSTLLDVVREENIGSHERDSCNSLNPSSNFNENEQNLRSLEVDKPILNGDELEIKMEDHNDALSCQIHDDYLLETNTPISTTEWRNLSSSEPECASTSGDWTTDSENALNTAQMLEAVPVLVECNGEFIQEEAPKDSFSLTTPMNDSHARYVNVLKEDLLDCSDSTEKYACQEMPNTRNVGQEYLPPRLMTSMTDQALEKEQCESFETPKIKTNCQTQNIRKKRRVHESLTVISKVSYQEDEDEWIGKTTSSKYDVAGKDNAMEDILPTVNETHHLQTEIHQFKHELLQYNSASSSACENPCGAIADSAHEENKESSGQNVLETCSIKCPNNEEISEPSSYVDKPTIKLEFQDNAPYRGDEEYVPQQVTCKGKRNKSKRGMLNPELEYIPTNLKKLADRSKRSCTVKDSLVQGNLACNIGAPEIDPVGYTDGIKLEFQTKAPCRVGKENVLEKVAHNCEKGKRQKHVPTNVRHLAAEHVSCSSDGSEVEESELAHGTALFKGFPSCVEKRDCVPKRKQQRIQTTDTCNSLFICDKKKDTENIFEEDLDSVSTNKNDSQEMPDAMETPQGLVSHLNEENNHRNDYPQSFQSCTQSTELDKEPLIKSTMFDNQEAAQEGRKKNHPSKQSPRSFRFLNYNDETYMKRKGLRKKKVCHNTGDVEINSYMNQKKKSKKEQITSHISGSDTALKSRLCVHDFYSISLQASNPKQVDACKGNIQPEILGHEPDYSSLQSSASELISRDKARNVLSNVKQSNKRKKGHPGGKEDKAESNNQSVSNSKKCVKQIKRQKANREEQVLKDCNNLKMKLTGDDGSGEDLMPTKTLTPKKKGKSAPVNKRYVSSPKKKKSDEKCVTQAEELDQIERDSVMEEDELRLRRSCRLRKRNAYLNFWCDVDFSEDSDTAIETEKHVKFFEEYKKKKEKKVGKSNPERDDEYIFKSTGKGRCHVKKGRRGSKSAESESMENKGTEKLHSEFNTPSKVLKSSEKSDRTPPKLLTPTARKKKAAGKGCKKICNLTFDNEQEEKRVKSKKKSMKEGRKMSVWSKRKQGSSLKKGVRQKNTSKSGTSTVYDSEKDLENCASTSKMKTLHQTMLAGMEKHDAVGSRLVSELRRYRKPNRSPKSEDEFSESEGQEEQPQSTEREDDIDIVYYQDLASLKSSYRRLQCMTETDLEEKLDENLTYLEHVILGHVHNERHEMFISSLQQLKQQQDYLISGPFTENQTEHVLEMLKKKLGHLDNMFDDMYDLLAYRCRVLMPTFLTKIVMDNENVSLKMAEQLLIKFSLNHKIHETTNNRNWRKF